MPDRLVGQRRAKSAGRGELSAVRGNPSHSVVTGMCPTPQCRSRDEAKRACYASARRTHPLVLPML
jgi:hypothetical protein